MQMESYSVPSESSVFERKITGGFSTMDVIDTIIWGSNVEINVDAKTGSYDFFVTEKGPFDVEALTREKSRNKPL
jgi:hypothetical protein